MDRRRATEAYASYVQDLLQHVDNLAKGRLCNTFPVCTPTRPSQNLRYKRNGGLGKLFF
ncbi:MAG: hypothetical protein WCB79_10110 [Halobacteriota archaeon]